MHTLGSISSGETVYDPLINFKPACDWYLEIAFVRDVSMCACAYVCVCVPAPEAINN